MKIHENIKHYDEDLAISVIGFGFLFCNMDNFITEAQFILIDMGFGC